MKKYNIISTERVNNKIYVTLSNNAIISQQSILDTWKDTTTQQAYVPITELVSDYECDMPQIIAFQTSDTYK